MPPSTTQVTVSSTAWPEKPAPAINPSVFPTLSSLQAFKDKSEKNIEEFKSRRKMSSGNDSAPSPLKQRRVDTSQGQTYPSFQEATKKPMFGNTMFPTLQSDMNKPAFINLAQSVANSMSSSLPSEPKVSPAISAEQPSPTNSQGIFKLPFIK